MQEITPGEPAILFHVAGAAHQPLAAVGSRRAPAKNIGRVVCAARVGHRSPTRQSLQKCLVKISPLCQRLTTGRIEQFVRERDTGIEAARSRFFAKFASLEAQQARRLREASIGQNFDVRGDMPGEVEVIVFPHNEHYTPGETGEPIARPRPTPESRQEITK